MKFSIIILSILFVACQERHNAKKAEKTGEKSPSLKEWSREYVISEVENDQAYFDDHQNFINPYYSVNYSENLITATTLIKIDCSDSIVGKIDISNDTIFLISDIIMASDRYCPEYHKFNFTINNPENKKYTIISTK